MISALPSENWATSIASISFALTSGSTDAGRSCVAHIVSFCSLGSGGESVGEVEPPTRPPSRSWTSTAASLAVLPTSAPIVVSAQLDRLLFEPTLVASLMP
jgi:hypothetical protein